MRKPLTWIVVVIALVVGFGGLCVVKRMGLITLEEAVDTSWAQIESGHQRRRDLIPALVAVVKAAAEHESKTLGAITAARSAVEHAQLKAVEAIKARDPEAASAALDRVGASTRSLLNVSVEAYPTLRANESFTTLQHQLEGAENRIHVARLRFNESVGAYNAEIRKWGGLPLCGGHDSRSRFSAADGAEMPPALDLAR